MNDISIKVDSGRAVASVQRFARTLQARQRLLVDLGMAMLISIRRTFREQGAPANSWAPIAASTRRSKPKIYGLGHKLLVLRGRLINSIGVQTEGENSVRIGTNLVYAAVQHFGSKDRGMGAGPQARIEGRDVAVKEHRYFRMRGLRTVNVEVEGKNGKKRTIRMKQFGPANRKEVSVGAHRRFQNIPGRPYMVFRPEDPERLQQIALAYVARCRKEAGLEGR